jgi:hypothetical protein
MYISSFLLTHRFGVGGFFGFLSAFFPLCQFILFGERNHSICVLAMVGLLTCKKHVIESCFETQSELFGFSKKDIIEFLVSVFVYFGNDGSGSD